MNIINKNLQQIFRPSFTGALHQIFKEQDQSCIKLFRKIEEERALHNSFYEVNTTLILKPDKNITTREQYSSLKNVKILNKTSANKIQQTKMFNASSAVYPKNASFVRILIIGLCYIPHKVKNRPSPIQKKHLTEFGICSFFFNQQNVKTREIPLKKKKQGKFLKLTKTKEKLADGIIFNGETLNTFLLRLRIRQGYPR